MLGLEVDLGDAQKAKEFLLSKGLLEKEFKNAKENGKIIFPIDKKINERQEELSAGIKKIKSARLIEFNFKSIAKKNHKEELKQKLSLDEIKKLKTAFDVLGDIAIMEVDKDLEKKEKPIAQYILSQNKNIKTVLKKVGRHEGEFRTQDVAYVLGENKKVATYKENNVTLKFDVQEVYFSPRLSTERKRIYEQINKSDKNEDILIMFSGAAPYPCVLAKNTKARQIIGVELNPQGHKWGILNVKANKLNNVTLINGDAKEVVPNIYQNILGLKTATDSLQLRNKVIPGLKIVELYTKESDFNENFNQLKSIISELREKGIFVYVHQPDTYKNNYFALTTQDLNLEIYQKMVSLIYEFDIDLIIHPSIFLDKKESYAAMVKNTRTFAKHYGRIYFENSINELLETKKQSLQFIKDTKITNYCIDTSHFLFRHNNEELIDFIKSVQRLCNTYFHLNDFDRKNNLDSRKLNKNSLIDLENVLPLVTKGVLEIKSKDESLGQEMLDSFNYLKNFTKKFDRIVMPLPKSAQDFLDAALSASRNGTVIHFYDFLHEKDIPAAAIEKIDKACKRNGRKYKILQTVKCGQHAPRTFRICVDFEVLND